MNQIWNRLFQKSELGFAIFWIIIYVVGMSVADSLSEQIGITKLLTVFFCAFVVALLVLWVKQNHLTAVYGLTKPIVPAGMLLYYIPLVLMASVNLWYGITINNPPLETMLYIISMFGVGFLEELIFRGFLFTAMCKDNVKTAIIVSSVTFGIGHIVNLINGSGMDLFSNLLQVGYAIAAGFLFTILFYKTKSLWACIITHGVLNALSVFAPQSGMTPVMDIISALALSVLSIGYALYILKTVPDPEAELR